MKVISLANQKGGCGKTITAVNLSSALSRRAYRVLLIDLDPQAHASFSLKKEGKVFLTELLERVSENKELPSQDFYTIIEENFYLIPSSLELASLEIKFSSHPNKLEILSLFLEKIKSNFDFCILDCPPNLGLLTLNALSASKYTIIPLNICDFSLRGIEMLENILIMLKEFKGSIPVCFYLLTQLDKRYKFSDQFTQKVKAKLGNLLLDTVIRTNIHLKEAASQGKVIFDYKPNSRGAEDFISLAIELEKLTLQTNWAPLFLKGKGFKEVYVVGDFNNWQRGENYRLKRIGDDIWGINLPLQKGKYCYKFLTDKCWLTDPHNQLAEDDSFGGKNSLLVIE